MSFWRGSNLKDNFSEYWPQWSPNYRPVPPGRQRPRPHNAALTNPTPYGGGSRRALLPDGIVPYSQADAAPIYGSSGIGRVWNAPGEQELYHDFNAPPPPAQLNLTFQSMSIEATVQWNHPHVSSKRSSSSINYVTPFEKCEGSTSYRYEVTVEGGNNVETLELPQWRYMIRLKLAQGTWYKVRVRAVSGPRTLAQGTVEFKSVMNRQELWNLYLKAAQYCGENMHRFEVFYRNKPQRYWDNIRYERGEIMEKYMKDSNGQQAAPINDTIMGLFFSSNLTKNGKLPPTSPFGDVRFVVRSEKLLVPDTRLYFADFYCTYSVHYVTVVACIPGSETDRFCQRALIPLKTDDNCFMRVYQRMGWLEFWVNENVWVEFFYTEDIPLRIEIHS